ncbi:hypothetical protein KP509_25G044900 [Ceratopteris richardii]|uniref:Uncharacterized protein n=1 Tax=Ceratopteris richardii TaxID=49495 RepID=A0A8T2RPW0_CERRI|nr:hypothetical protein KP509_25G044900 [Ceratopteris richardii]
MSLFRRKNNGVVSECVSLAKLTQERIEAVKKRKSVLAKHARDDVAKLLERGDDADAAARVEYVFKEENKLSAYELLGQYCKILGQEINGSEKESRTTFKEAVAGLIYAAPRCGEFGELQKLRDILSCRFGPEYDSCAVSPQLIQILSTSRPNCEQKVNLLNAIAYEKKIDWYCETASEAVYEVEKLCVDTKPELHTEEEFHAIADGRSQARDQNEKAFPSHIEMEGGTSQEHVRVKILHQAVHCQEQKAQSSAKDSSYCESQNIENDECECRSYTTATDSDAAISASIENSYNLRDRNTCVSDTFKEICYSTKVSLDNHEISRYRSEDQITASHHGEPRQHPTLLSSDLSSSISSTPRSMRMKIDEELEDLDEIMKEMARRADIALAMLQTSSKSSKQVEKVACEKEYWMTEVIPSLTKEVTTRKHVYNIKEKNEESVVNEDQEQEEIPIGSPLHDYFCSDDSDKEGQLLQRRYKRWIRRPDKTRPNQLSQPQSVTGRTHDQHKSRDNAHERLGALPAAAHDVKHPLHEWSNFGNSPQNEGNLETAPDKDVESLLKWKSSQARKTEEGNVDYAGKDAYSQSSIIRAQSTDIGHGNVTRIPRLVGKSVRTVRPK